MASKPQNPKQKLFIFSLISLGFFLLLLGFSFQLKSPPKPHYPDLLSLHDANPLTTTNNVKPKWYNLVSDLTNGTKVKVGLVNIDEGEEDFYGRDEVVETVRVRFDRVSETLRWEDLYPEWIDEWGPQKCPEIPMPSAEDHYRDIDVVVAKVPCGEGGGDSDKRGIRDVYRLQVNLVVANLVVGSGWVKPDVDRTVYVVFVGSCGPMVEIFRCDDMVTHVWDYWVYKPDLRRLKQKVLMPVGSCQIAPPLAETGKEAWRYFMSQSRLSKLNYTTHHQREAYVTVLHSSEAYVCGAIALAQSIIQNNSSRDLVLLHDKSIGPKSLRGLRAAGWKTKLIQRIRSPSAKPDAYNEWNYSKLRVWQLTKYDKVIFIDADLIVLRNIDKFFIYPQLSVAANDKMLFNSGVMLIEPSLCMFEDLMRKSFKLSSYNGGDQGFLNEVFTWWHRWPKSLNRLKIFTREGNEKHEIAEKSKNKDIHLIHYLGLKPWMCYRDYDCNWDMLDHHIFASDNAHKKWWKVYDAMPKRLQQYCGLTEHMDARIKKWRGRAKAANWPNGHWNITVKDPRHYHLVANV